MPRRASVLGRALARRRAGYLALILGTAATVIARMASSELVAVPLGVGLAVFAGGVAWDVVVIVGLAIDATRRRRGRRPIHVGVDYGAGDETWFEATPGPEPYRSCDGLRLLARGEPAAAAWQVGLVLAMRLGFVLTLAAITAVGVYAARPKCRPSSGDSCLGSAKTACSTVRQAAMQWKAVNPDGACPMLEELKAEKDLDLGFRLEDPW